MTRNARALRAGAAGALFLSLLPLLTPLFAVFGPRGFIWALVGLNGYYGVARRVFGAAMYPVQEFGIVPTLGGTLAAAPLYGAIGFVAGVSLFWLVEAAKRQD